MAQPGISYLAERLSIRRNDQGNASSESFMTYYFNTTLLLHSKMLSLGQSWP